MSNIDDKNIKIDKNEIYDESDPNSYKKKEEYWSRFFELAKQKNRNMLLNFEVERMKKLNTNTKN